MRAVCAIALLLVAGVPAVRAASLAGEYAGAGAGAWSLRLTPGHDFALTLPGGGAVAARHEGAWFVEGDRLYLVVDRETPDAPRASVWMQFAIEHPEPDTVNLRFLSPAPSLARKRVEAGSTGIDVTLDDVRRGNVQVLPYENVLHRVAPAAPPPPVAPGGP